MERTDDLRGKNLRWYWCGPGDAAILCTYHGWGYPTVKAKQLFDEKLRLPNRHTDQCPDCVEHNKKT